LTVASEQTFVTLLGGFTVAVDVLELAWDLENRGLSLKELDGGVLEVLPVERLQPADAAAIRKHKPALLAICRYVARM
jgi:hypothetical protein